MSSLLSTTRQGPTFATRPTMATAAGVKPPPKAAPADAPKPAAAAKAAPADAPKPAAAAKEKKRTARPTSLPESLVKKQLEIVRAGKPDAQTIPPEPLMPFPVPRYPCGTPAIFAAWASQHAESLPTYPDVGKGGTTGSEVAGVFVVCRNKVVGYVPGTAFLVRNKAGTEIVAHPAKFVGHAPQLDRGKLRESLVAMFASPKHDYIPTLADSLDFELAVKIRELIDADKSVLKSILPVAGGRDDGSPWKLPASKEAVGTFYELLKDVAESIVAIKISKPRAARASVKTGSGDDDDDDDFMDVTVPVAPPATPPRKRPADDDLAPPAKHKAVASAEDKPARAAPEKRKPAEEAKPKPKFTGRLLINGPETLFPQLQIPAQLFHEASDLFSSIGHAGFSSDPGTVSLTLTKTAVDADIRAKLDALTPEQRLLMASIVEPLALSQTTILDCSNQTDPVTVTQPDGSRVTGTIVATAPPPSELYAALLACRLTAAEWTIPPSAEEEEQEHADDDDDDDEDEDEEEEEETAGDEEESAGDDDDEYDQ